MQMPRTAAACRQCHLVGALQAESVENPADIGLAVFGNTQDGRPLDIQHPAAMQFRYGECFDRCLRTGVHDFRQWMRERLRTI